jgi:hypothetical protein
MSRNRLSALSYTSERYQTKVEGENNRLALWPPPIDDKYATTNHPGYIIIYGGNIKAKLYVLKLRATSVEKTWPLLVNVIQKFWKAVQMCVPPYIQAGHGTQLSKSVLSRQNRDVWDPYCR